MTSDVNNEAKNEMYAVTLEPDDSLKEAITMSFRHTFACMHIMSDKLCHRGQK